MVNEKGLSESSADQIGEFVRLNGSTQLIEELKAGKLGSNKRAVEGLEAMKLLFDYCKQFQIEPVVSFDLSLARGLDYYTGLIYEVIIKDNNVECGSIAAGGRYDNLAGMFSESTKWSVPCVGVSIGIERILSIIEEQMANEITTSTHVLVASIGKNLTEKRMQLLCKLWDANINAEHIYKKNAKLLNQYQYCEDKNIPYVIVFGEEEVKQNVVKLRDVQSRVEVKVVMLIRRYFIMGIFFSLRMSFQWII